MAGNTPFKRWKREVHEGGVADPCIVSWPARLGAAGGGIRHQFAHAMDVLPTVLELVGIDPPPHYRVRPPDAHRRDQLRPAAGGRRRGAPGHRATQYFEMLGSRAIYHDGWKAVTFKPLGPLYNDGLDWNAPFDEDRWELYHVADDLTEIHDLADREPERLADMVERWWVEARNNQVFPLDNRVLHTIVQSQAGQAGAAAPVHLLPGHLVGAGDGGRQREEPEPRIEADLTVDDDGVGKRCGVGPGVGARRLLPLPPRRRSPLRAQPVRQGAARGGGHRADPAGPPPAVVSVRAGRAGRGQWNDSLDGRVVAEAEIPTFTVASFSATGSGLTCGYEVGPPVGEGYDAPFRCTAIIHSVTVTLSEHVPVNPMVEFERIMAEQ